MTAPRAHRRQARPLGTWPRRDAVRPGVAGASWRGRCSWSGRGTHQERHGGPRRDGAGVDAGLGRVIARICPWSGHGRRRHLQPAPDSRYGRRRHLQPAPDSRSRPSSAPAVGTRSGQRSARSPPIVRGSRDRGQPATPPACCHGVRSARDEPRDRAPLRSPPTVSATRRWPASGSPTRMPRVSSTTAATSRTSTTRASSTCATWASPATGPASVSSRCGQWTSSTRLRRASTTCWRSSSARARRSHQRDHRGRRVPRRR